MKKLLFVFTICLLTTAGFSQVQRKVVKDTSTASANSNKQNRKQTFAELDLTKEQKSKLKEMRQANKSGRDEVENDTTLTADQKKQKLNAMKSENARKMNDLLTDDQKKKMRKMRKQKMNDE